jgi:hypothetical protein
MKLNSLRVATLAGACAIASGAAHADAGSWDPSWSLSGFGTLGYVRTDTDQALFAGPGQPGGASRDGTLGVDSKLGAQVNARANDVFSATVQAISQRNGDGNFRPGIEWAFLKARLTPELSVRAGRIGAPLFAVSDFRNIGYANLWLRTPLEVYGQVPFSNFDGADAIYQHTLGTTALTAQLFAGKSDSAASNSDVNVKHEFGLNVSAEFDNGITLRVGRVQGKLTVSNGSVSRLLAAIAATPYAGVGDEIAATGKEATFTGVGIAYDHDNWVANAEYTRRKTSSYISSTTGWEGTLGYRVGRFTPYAVVARIRRDSSNVDDTIPSSQLATLVDGLLQRQDAAQKTASIGVRWDAWKNVDVKAQFDRIRPDSGAVGLFNGVASGFDSAVNVYSVAVDFVF